jgi:hypothetical protein
MLREWVWLKNKVGDVGSAFLILILNQPNRQNSQQIPPTTFPIPQTPTARPHVLPLDFIPVRNSRLLLRFFSLPLFSVLSLFTYARRRCWGGDEGKGKGMFEGFAGLGVW